MSSFIEQLWQENPRARKQTPDQAVRALKERIRKANRMGATSIRLSESEMCAAAYDFLKSEGFQLLSQTTIGCGRDIFDSRDPDCPCCKLCTERVPVKHLRVSWKEQ